MSPATHSPHPLKEPSREAIVSWVERADAARSPTQGQVRRSGYVEAGGQFFHVMHTTDGPIVSRLQLSPDPDDAGALVPRHNLFSVGAAEHARALDAWAERLAQESAVSAHPSRMTGGRIR